MNRHPPFDPGAVGVYLHVPFCRTVCGYCDFFRLKSAEGVPSWFVEALSAEAGLYAETPRVRADSVYLGGGTPSLLGGPDLLRLLGRLGEAFDVMRGAEVTLEANPEDVTEEAVEAWTAAGVTRLSLGVQSFDPEVLAALDRAAPPEACLQALDAAAGAFAHLSVDLMTGVPGQNPASHLADLDVLYRFPLDHVSVYSLDLHPKTKLRSDVVKGLKRLPSEDEAADLYASTHRHLTGHGFEHYEISNYARPGGRSRHNLRYWLGGDYIGLGPSAWGRFRGHLMGNPRSAPAWREAVSAGRHPYETIERLTPERVLEDRLIFGLRTSDGVDWNVVEEVSQAQGHRAEERVAPLLSAEYGEVEDGRFRLTPTGFALSSEIIAYLLPDGFGGRKVN